MKAVVAAGAQAVEQRGGAWRLWALVPVLLLAVAVGIYVTASPSLTELIGTKPPPADELDVRWVQLERGEIRVRVTNPQPEQITIASVTVDDAIVPFTVDGPTTLDRLRSTTVEIPFDWVENDPLTVGVTSSSGIETVAEVAAAVETPGFSADAVLGYAVLGILVGVVPVALGLLWLPSLRRLDKRWLAAFMALTAGLLSFLAVEALSEAFERQAALPSALGGSGLVLLGVAASYLGMVWVSGRARRGSAGPLSGLALATLVALGIGLHNLGEGLAIGTSFRFSEIALGSFLVVGFMIHNVTEGLGIAAPAAEAGVSPSFGRLAWLAMLAGFPAVIGAWLGGFLAGDLLAVLFFGIAAGAALEVVVEVGRYIQRQAPGGLRSGHVIGGFLAGITVMVITGVLAG